MSGDVINITQIGGSKMIILSILLVALIIALAAIVIRLIFKVNWPVLNRLFIVFIAVAIAMSFVSIGVGVGCRNTVDNLANEHQTLMLYYNAVQYSDNEYMRFDYYNRVNDFNARYAAAVENAKSPWVGIFYPPNWSESICPIEFHLNEGLM
jgi:glucan phosphoethanolaminetransferase (alkaline phosphatase superfamily)